MQELVETSHCVSFLLFAKSFSFGLQLRNKFISWCWVWGGERHYGQFLGELGGVQEGALHLGQVMCGNGGQITIVTDSLMKPKNLHENKK